MVVKKRETVVRDEMDGPSFENLQIVPKEEGEEHFGGDWDSGGFFFFFVLCCWVVVLWCCGVLVG